MPGPRGCLPEEELEVNGVWDSLRHQAIRGALMEQRVGVAALDDVVDAVLAAVVDHPDAVLDALVGTGGCHYERRRGDHPDIIDARSSTYWRRFVGGWGREPGGTIRRGAPGRG